MKSLKNLNSCPAGVLTGRCRFTQLLVRLSESRYIMEPRCAAEEEEDEEGEDEGEKEEPSHSHSVS